MCQDILACCCPPLAVCFKRGCNLECFVNLILTCFGWFPGCIHACWILHRDKKGGNGNTGNVNVMQTVNTAASPQPPVVFQQPQVQPQHVTVNIPMPMYPPTPPGASVMNPISPVPHNVPQHSAPPPYFGEGGKY